MKDVRDILSVAPRVPDTSVAIEPAGIDVWRLFFPGGRTQRVRVRRETERYVFESTVARRADLHFDRAELARRVLLRNRTARLVHFFVSPDGALAVRSSHPASSLDAEELWFHVLAVAREADAWEAELSDVDEG